MPGLTERCAISEEPAREWLKRFSVFMSRQFYQEGRDNGGPAPKKLHGVICEARAQEHEAKPSMRPAGIIRGR
jgi:hypothetical protein